MADKKKSSSTTPKKLSNKEIRKARRDAKAQVERIPAGMSAKDYADAAFRKKVTIIMGCILLAFIVGVVAVLVGAHLKTEQHNADFQRIEDEFKAESESVKAQLAEIEANGGSFEDKAAVKIEVTDENYSYWIQALDACYQLDFEDPDYGCYGGATIHLQGQFVKRVYAGNNVNYWIYRTHEDHQHGEASVETTAKAEKDANGDTQIDIALLNDPIEVIFDGEFDVPADGTWVDVTGVVGVDSNNSMSAVHHTEMVTVEAPEHEHE